MPAQAQPSACVGVVERACGACGLPLAQYLRRGELEACGCPAAHGSQATGREFGPCRLLERVPVLHEDRAYVAGRRSRSRACQVPPKRGRLAVPCSPAAGRRVHGRFRRRPLPAPQARHFGVTDRLQLHGSDRTKVQLSSGWNSFRLDANDNTISSPQHTAISNPASPVRSSSGDDEQSVNPPPSLP